MYHLHSFLRFPYLVSNLDRPLFTRYKFPCRFNPKNHTKTVENRKKISICCRSIIVFLGTSVARQGPPRPFSLPACSCHHPSIHPSNFGWSYDEITTFLTQYLRLSNRCGAIPSIHILRRPKDSHVLTASTWACYIPKCLRTRRSLVQASTGTAATSHIFVPVGATGDHFPLGLSSPTGETVCLAQLQGCGGVLSGQENP